MERPLLQYQVHAAARYFRTSTIARIITVLLFLGVFVFVGVGMFFFFKGGFGYIFKDEFLRPVVALYAYELFFLVVGALMFFSALLSGLFGLFRSQTASWIMASPRFRAFPWYVLWRVVFASTWPLLVIALPALLALRSVTGLTAAAFIATVGSIILLALLSAFSALALLLAIGTILREVGAALKLRLLTIGTITLAIVATFLIIGFAFSRYVAPLDFAVISQSQNLALGSASIESVAKNFSLVPTHFSALSLLRFQQGNYTVGVVLLIPLLVLVLIAALVFFCARESFLPCPLAGFAGRGVSRRAGQESEKFAPRIVPARLYRNTRDAF